MLSISGSNSRKSVADWTLVNIHYFYKEGWICVSVSDSLLVSLILSEKPPNTWAGVSAPCSHSRISDVHKHTVTAEIKS